jgi:hypothetical protein
VYLPGDEVDGQWADDRPPRAFHPHSAAGALTVGAAEGAARTPTAAPAPGPATRSGPGVSQGGTP